MIEKLSHEQKKIIESFHKRGLPIKTAPIANAFGIDVFYTDSWENDTSGMIRRINENKYEIFVNKKHPPNRRRFTIAHELAHFLLHTDLLEDETFEDHLLRAVGSRWSNAAVESEANALAADILMPWNLIEREYSRGAKTIESLSEKFEVSKDAMSVRVLGTHYRNPDKP